MTSWRNERCPTAYHIPAIADGTITTDTTIPQNGSVSSTDAPEPQSHVRSVRRRAFFRFANRFKVRPMCPL